MSIPIIPVIFTYNLLNMLSVQILNAQNRSEAKTFRESFPLAFKTIIASLVKL